MLVPPSPNVQLHEVAPVDVSVKATASGVYPELGVYVKAADGADTVIPCEVVEAPPLIVS